MRSMLPALILGVPASTMMCAGLLLGEAVLSAIFGAKVAVNVLAALLATRVTAPTVTE
jgi:hypothetical protein